MENYIIRPATKDDTDVLVEIAREAWAPIYEGFRTKLGDDVFALFYPDPLGGKAEQIRLNVESGTTLLTEAEGKILGFIHYMYDEESGLATIGNNAVSSAARGLGIGGKQYAYVLDLLRSAGARAVRVTTGLDEAHAPARRAYERAGFSRSTESVTYMMKL